MIFMFVFKEFIIKYSDDAILCSLDNGLLALVSIREKYFTLYIFAGSVTKFFQEEGTTEISEEEIVKVKDILLNYEDYIMPNDCKMYLEDEEFRQETINLKKKYGIKY